MVQSGLSDQCDKAKQVMQETKIIIPDPGEKRETYNRHSISSFAPTATLVLLVIILVGAVAYLSITTKVTVIERTINVTKKAKLERQDGLQEGKQDMILPTLIVDIVLPNDIQPVEQGPAYGVHKDNDKERLPKDENVNILPDISGASEAFNRKNEDFIKNLLNAPEEIKVPKEDEGIIQHQNSFISQMMDEFQSMINDAQDNVFGFFRTDPVQEQVTRPSEQTTTPPVKSTDFFEFPIPNNFISDVMNVFGGGQNDATQAAPEKDPMTTLISTLGEIEATTAHSVPSGSLFPGLDRKISDFLNGIMIGAGDVNKAESSPSSRSSEGSKENASGKGNWESQSAENPISNIVNFKKGF